MLGNGQTKPNQTKPTQLNSNSDGIRIPGRPARPARAACRAGPAPATGTPAQAGRVVVPRALLVGLDTLPCAEPSCSTGEPWLVPNPGATSAVDSEHTDFSSKNGSLLETLAWRTPALPQGQHGQQRAQRVQLAPANQTKQPPQATAVPTATCQAHMPVSHANPKCQFCMPFG